MSTFHTSPTASDAARTVELHGPASQGEAAPTRWACDPLEPDDVDDEVIVTSSQRLLRVAVAAADAGVRFARDSGGQDAAAWMLTPRAVFGGRPAIEACQDLKEFNRSIVLHGLRLGLDADPASLDALLADDGPDHAEVAMAGSGDMKAVMDDPLDVRLPRPLLLTCWVACDGASDRVFAFCGVVTDRPSDLVDRVIGRYGAEAAATADFQVGFDKSAAMATAMISDAMADTLTMAAADPASPLAQGLDVVVEQRFAA